MTWHGIKRRLYMNLAKLKGQRCVHFLHIGKTGGTAVKEALKGNLHTKKQVIFLHSHEFTLADVPEGNKVFFFLRDPISRFISGFYSRKRRGQPRYFYPWNEEEQQAFNMFDTPNELALSLSDNNIKRRREAHKAMKSISHVRDFYSNWYMSKDYFLSRLSDILLVGRQETLNQDFVRLKRLLDLPENIQLPSRDKKAHRTPDNLDKRLEKDAIRNLSKWYEKDYAFLELCDTYAESINYLGEDW